MRTFRDSLNEEMQNPEFKQLWEASIPERIVVSKMANDLYYKKTTIEELSKASSISSSRIHEIEEGEPLTATELIQLGEAVGYKMQLSY